MTKVRLVKRTKGCELRTDDGLTLTTLSWMDAAELLFHLKDAIRGDRIGRGCIDQVHEQRRRNAVTPAFNASHSGVNR